MTLRAVRMFLTAGAPTPNGPVDAMTFLAARLRAGDSAIETHPSGSFAPSAELSIRRSQFRGCLEMRNPVPQRHRGREGRHWPCRRAVVDDPPAYPPAGMDRPFRRLEVFCAG